MLLGVLWSAGATAKDGSSALNIQTVLGFSDTIRLGRWAPLAITVENSGETVNGTLEVEVTSGDELEGTVFTFVHRRRLELTRDARKRFHFTVFIDNPAQPIQIRVVSQDRVVAHRAIDLRHRFTEARLVLVLSRNVDLDYLNEGTGGRARVTYPHPELLPHRWQGYDGVAALVVHGVTLEQLDPRQYDALKKWLSQGGVLVTSGGPDYASLWTARLAELLPATPTGLATIRGDADFRTALGESFVAPRPFQIHKVTRSRGRVTASAGQAALIIESALGLGRVTYLTFDIDSYPFEGWSGMGQLWFRLLGLRKPGSTRAAPSIEASVVPTIVKGLGESFPGRLIVLTFLVAYLGMLGIAYRLISQDTAARVWIPWTPVALPLLFAPAAYFLFVSLLFPPGASATVVSVVEPLVGGPFARVDFDLGVYGNRPGRVGLKVAQTGPVFLPRVDPDRPDQAASWILRDGNPRLLEVSDRRPFALHALWGTDVISFDLQVSVAQTQTGLSLTVQNHTNRPLESAWLVFNGSVYALGAISEVPASHYELTSEISVPANEWRNITGGLQGLSVRDRFALETALNESVKSYRRTDGLPRDEALLIAVSVTPEPLLASSTSLQITEVGLVLARFPVDLSPAHGMDPAPVRRGAR
ncbi:MAG: hypothetical protein ACR2RB_09310 [Gammaproteobacteria bacterium]